MRIIKHLGTTAIVLCLGAGSGPAQSESPDRTDPVVIVEEPCPPGSTHMKLRLEAASGDYWIQTANDLLGPWTNEMLVTVLSGQSPALHLPLQGRDVLLIRAQGIVLTNEAVFLTLDRWFEPEIFCSDTESPSILWTWSDGSTSSDYPVASKDFGFAEPREQRLTADPSSPITTINIGFDGSDGGDPNINLRPPQAVAAVTFPQPLTHLRYWASSYNPIMERLDFTGFARLEVIEAFRCESLRELVVSDLPSLRRVNVENCDLQELDLSGNPNLGDVRCAQNAFTEIRVERGTGPNIWHWCTRDNPQLTQRFQDVMTNFYSLKEFWSWNNNQDGHLSFVSSQLTSVWAYRNHYTSADLSSQPNLRSIRLQQNSLTNIVLDGSTALREVNLRDNQLPTEVLDSVLAIMDASAPRLTQLDLARNAGFPSPTGYNHYSNLVSRGVAVFVDWADTNDGRINVPGGADAITFVTSTRHPHLEIRTVAGASVDITWHWGDGTVNRGNLLADHDFGVEGVYTNYVQVTPSSAVTYFGAPRNAPGQGGITAVYGAANFPNLNFLYLYQEDLTELSLAGCANLRQLHLARTLVSEAVCDQWFIDLDQAVVGPVSNADFWYPAGRRTAVSDDAYASLIAKGYVMRPF
jgi:uncharacterized protein YjbI with pentapeptide repeats